MLLSTMHHLGEDKIILTATHRASAMDAMSWVCREVVTMVSDKYAITLLKLVYSGTKLKPVN